MPAVPEFTATEARRLAIGGAGLGTARPRSVRPEHVRAVLRDLGALQLDTISTLARAHELVPAARLGSADRTVIDTALWGEPGAVPHPGPVETVEYWAHAACVVPVEKWPAYAFRRREYARRGYRWHQLDDASVEQVRRLVRESGPLTTGDLGGAKASSQWWDWSDAKIAIEWLLDVGEVVCVRRTGWRRTYDLAERALPPEALEPRAHWVDDQGVVGPSDADCHDELVADAAVLLGVATIADLADVPRLSQEATKSAVRRLIDRGVLTEVRVRTWDTPAYVHVNARSASTRSRAVLLSPFDPLVWERDRLHRMFGMHYRIESYTPAAKRVRGYYAMPVLAGDRIVGTVDPARTDKGSTLTARTVVLESATSKTALERDARAVATALAEAARWVGATRVTVENVSPSSAAALVRQSVTEVSRRMSP
jgi:uncharacterized protein